MIFSLPRFRPPGRPKPGTPPARTGREPLSGCGPLVLFPLDSFDLERGVHSGRAVADAVLLCTQVLEQTTATRKPVYEEVLCRLFLGEVQGLTGHLEEAHILTERTFALALQAQKLPVP